MKQVFRKSFIPSVSVVAIPFLAAFACKAAPQVSLRVDTSHPSASISRYVYGSNEDAWDTSGAHLTFGRQGGNRMTAYNWENNASNAGSDWHNQSDNYLGGGDIPGEVPRKAVAQALEHNATFLVTVPMAGYVAADKKGDGDVNQTPNYLEVRFRKSVPKKDSAFTYPPDLSDSTVYQDEFVSWLEKRFPTRSANASIWYSLDNEPDLWSETHSRIHPQKLTYRELLDRTTDYAAAIKAVAPSTLIFGPASYGWGGYVGLQGASDGNGRDFLEFYLSGMRDAEERKGKRLLDVLDLHWYPEAKGGGKRITEADASPAVAAARMQATRSLWDPTYVEDSWITQSLGGKPINLLARMKEKISRCYPGTKLAFTEYQYGGSEDISGAIAEADALGIFGRSGVFAAAYWPSSGSNSYVHAGFDAFRNYDGNGAAFGDLALPTTSSDPTHVSIYGSAFSKEPGKAVIVIVNQAFEERTCSLGIDGVAGKSVRQFSLTKQGAKLRANRFAEPQGSGFALSLPAESVNVLEIK